MMGSGATSAPRTVAGTRFWTNPSVLALAGDRDPVEAVADRARELVFHALEGGWDGPPYDPFQLAELIRIPLVPREDLHDARIVSREGRPQIEFNPTRPRGRVRFSVAHELAHTFFPDYQKTIRYRSRPEPAPTDEWQLELLCNVAAAELLMPIGSFTDLEGEPLTIERLMELRKKFDVSTEALLLRIVKLTERPSAVFAAARTHGDRTDSPFRIDYVVGSRNWTPPFARGRRLSPGSVLGECTAVGYTAKGMLQVAPAGRELYVECVGAPAYPGEKLPRVVGVVLPSDAATPKQGIAEVLGDARAPRGAGPHLIVHLVNDKTATWGGAFARALKERWPEAQAEFKKWAPDNLTLGKVHVTDVDPDIAVATMIAQKGYGPSVKPRIRYAALHEALVQVGQIARQRGARIHMPRVGAGQAGGDWSIIREMIDENLVRRGLEVMVYTLPGTRVPEQAQTRLALA